MIERLICEATAVMNVDRPFPPFLMQVINDALNWKLVELLMEDRMNGAPWNLIKWTDCFYNQLWKCAWDHLYGPNNGPGPRLLLLNCIHWYNRPSTASGPPPSRASVSYFLHNVRSLIFWSVYQMPAGLFCAYLKPAPAFCHYIADFLSADCGVVLLQRHNHNIKLYT